MKKLGLAVLALGLTAGSVMAQVRFGVQGGIPFTNVKVENNGTKITSDGRTGYTAGVLAEIPLGPVSFRPAVNYIQKSSSSQYLGVQTTTTTSHIEVPLDIVLNLGSEGSGFFIGAGPALSKGFKGTHKATVLGQEVSTDVKYGDNTGEIKSTDFSANLLGGYQFGNGLFVTANYNLGLSNLSNESNERRNTRYVGLRLGYLFGSR